MDDKVDKLYHRLQTQAAASTADVGSDPVDDVLTFEYQRTLQLEPDYERQKQLKSRMLTTAYVNKLTTMFRASPYDPLTRSHQEAASTKIDNSAEVPLHFIQKSTLRGIPIARLPDEILLHILSIVIRPSPNAQYPDISSLERGFGLVSRKARILTLSSVALWKTACLNIYKPPLQLEIPASVTSVSPTEALASKLYGNDYRLMWIEQPRIRTDGVYISQITYVRRGALDSMSATYYDPTHCVTYYRYLCFLPSGDVVSLLSHDIPSVVVPNLLASSKARGQTTGATSARKHAPSQASASSSGAPQAVTSATLGAGYTVGRWRLLHLPGGAASAEGQMSGSSSATGPSTIVELSSLEDPRIASRSDVKYSFKMVCRLKSTVRGKNNKLEMLHLLARNQRTGDESPIPIKSSGTTGSGMPSFYFSRVLSYD
jgi:F-box protein 9